MGVRLYEGDKNETGGAGIEITDNKVVNLILRSLNNLIKINSNNEVYTDLQLDDNLSSSTNLPVGVTVGRVMQANGWLANGTLLSAKTTSGDEIRFLFADDGKLYTDNGTGTFTQIYLKPEVDALLNQLRQELSDAAFSGEYDDLLNKPTLGTASTYDVGTTSGTIPVIQTNGKLPSTIIPAVTSSVYTVTNVSDLTTLSNATQGDYGIVTSTSQTFILSAEPYSTQSNWVEMLTPSSNVTSVNGQTGPVVLTTSDISEGDTSHQYVTSNEKNVWNAKLGTNDVATVAKTGRYADLTGKPDITTSQYMTQAQYDALPSDKESDGNNYFIFTS